MMTLYKKVNCCAALMCAHSCRADWSVIKNHLNVSLLLMLTTKTLSSLCCENNSLAIRRIRGSCIHQNQPLPALA
jgi:hypothetical protein